MALPKELYVTEESDNDGSKWLSAHADQVEAVETADNECPTVGRYQLVEVSRLRLLKNVEVVSTKSKKR